MIRKGNARDAETIASIKIDTWRKTYLNIFPDSILDNLDVKQETQRYLQNLKDREWKSNCLLLFWREKARRVLPI